jgi:hypothetical protein
MEKGLNHLLPLKPLAWWILRWSPNLHKKIPMTSTIQKVSGELTCLGFPNKPKSNKQLDKLEGGGEGGHKLALWKRRSESPLLVPQGFGGEELSVCDHLKKRWGIKRSIEKPAV